ncbi:hypothetical protein [Nostoc sp.]|uniref:hypothetical protein n=1 Tax=Nostoc sp. TaxID=1180 RepID=UPI002FF7FCE6
MAIGHVHGTVASGATGSYIPADSPSIDIPPNATGGYDVTYTYFTFFAGQNAYHCLINGIDIYPGAGWLIDSCVWILDTTDVPHDCVNGVCIPASTHGTLGLYASLAACEVACGVHGCSGQCVGNSDWAQIEGLSNQLKNRNCG